MIRSEPPAVAGGPNARSAYSSLIEPLPRLILTATAGGSDLIRRIIALMDANEIAFKLPRGGQMVLRPVTDADEEFLLSIYAGTRAEELAQAQWQAGQQEAFVKWQFDLQRREYDARFPDAEYYVLVIDDCPAGRIWIGQDEQQIRLLDIAILPEFQNRGAGTLLLTWLIDESKRSGKALRHMVFVLNPDAHRFYERLGFVVIEEFGAYKHMEWKSEPHADE